MPTAVPIRLAAAVCAAAALSLLVLLGVAAPAQGALGDRPLAKGARGADVKALQSLLSEAGFKSRADGVFGAGTRRAVIRLERELGLRPDGRVTAADVRRIRTALQPAKTPGGFSYSSEREATTRPRAVSAQEAPGAKAVLTEDGLAIPPADAPPAVKQIIAAGNKIATKPYRYGGGHGKWEDSAYDCSGSVSYALYGARLLKSPMPSGSFESWAEPGEGKWVTIYANAGHMYMEVAGLRFDTSGRRKTGSRWQRDPRPTQSYRIRHPEGL